MRSSIKSTENGPYKYHPELVIRFSVNSTYGIRVLCIYHTFTAIGGLARLFSKCFSFQEKDAREDHLSFLLDHLPKPQNQHGLLFSLSDRETSELGANILQTKHEAKWL
jgi:hypothetical protein